MQNTHTKERRLNQSLLSITCFPKYSDQRKGRNYEYFMRTLLIIDKAFATAACNKGLASYAREMYWIKSIRSFPLAGQGNAFPVRREPPIPFTANDHPFASQLLVRCIRGVLAGLLVRDLASGKKGKKSGSSRRVCDGVEGAEDCVMMQQVPGCESGSEETLQRKGDESAPLSFSWQ